jgi:NO-binding membrane sensor protein with MHYT domain
MKTSTMNRPNRTSLCLGLLTLQLACLVLGTQMPGAWRDGLQGAMGLPFGVSSWAHFVLFGGMAALAAARPLAWRWQWVLLAALALALLTEGLQFLAIDRHPRWLDVGIDMGGALLGVALGGLSTDATRPKPRP